MRLLVCGLAVALLAVVAHATDGDSSTVTSTAIHVENAPAGSPGWLGIDKRDQSIEVYASAADALPGDSVAVHVSTPSTARYRLMVYPPRRGGGGGGRARPVVAGVCVGAPG